MITNISRFTKGSVDWHYMLYDIYLTDLIELIDAVKDIDESEAKEIRRSHDSRKYTNRY